jgi:hypothetical protein
VVTGIEETMSSPTPHPPKILKNIRERNREFYSDRRGIGALKDLQQTFPNPWLYVAELLQNAVDEEATRIVVQPQDDGSLIFEHNGSPFSERDIESLCMRGVSSKGAGTVGFMGIGFKSVFRSFERVEVSSAAWRFALTVSSRKGERFGDNQRDWLGAVLPEWDDIAPPPATGMNCRFRLCRRLTDLPPTTDDLERVLGTDQVLLALLAWQEIQELTWNGQTWILKREETPLTDGSGSRVALRSHDLEGETARQWMLFSRAYQPSDKAIARFLEHRQLTPSIDDEQRIYEEASRSRRVAVFCEIDDDGDPRPLERGSAFALLPTGVTFPLGLHVQADWLLVVSRRELMQIEGNEWHEEILCQIPILLKDFLAWLVETPWPENSEWNLGFDALPGKFSGEREPDAWFEGDIFRASLVDCLIDLPFLPVPSGQGNSVSFITPRQGYQLPRSLANLFEDDGPSHRVLFGDRVFSSAMLGDRALRYLNDLALLHDLSAEHLEEQWGNGAIVEWIEQLEEQRRDSALAELLEALAALDTDEAWKSAKLQCLPSEEGGWICREGAKRFPPDWAILAQEDSIRGAFELLLGKRSEIVRWSFDRSLQQPRSPGSSYLTPILPAKLEDLAEQWWESLSDEPTDSQLSLALRFTAWVRAKQQQRKNLVRKLLSRDRENHPLLLPTPEVLIADPYAEACRRAWFPELPVVASDYLAIDAEASPGDWRSFLESLTPPPQGRFALVLTAGSYSWQGLRELMGENFTPPGLRSSYKTVTWRGLSLTSTEYKVLDADLPKPIAQRFADSTPLARDESRAVAIWIAESPAMLKEYSQCKLAYIPLGYGFHSEVPLARDSSWKKTVQRTPWVFTASGDGPFCAADVLDEVDPVRPDAPVADLPLDFVRLLKDAGIEFGSRLPDAPAIIRLRVQGPTSPLEELLELARNALEEVAEDTEKQEFLKETLRHTNLFPLPPGRESLDRLARVSLDRVVRGERGRSTFGSWITTADSFSVDSPEGQLFQLIGAMFPFPTNTTGRQALGFLAWVWRTRPDADRVRNLLPRAYQYVREDVEADELGNQIEGVRDSIVVFIQNKRQWLPVTDETVFLNDFPEDVHLPDDLIIWLATPGHLGDGRNDQIAVAGMLGLKLLSSRFRVETLLAGSSAAPDRWQQAFAKVQRELLNRLSTSDAEEQEEQSSDQRPLFSLSRCELIDTIVFDRGIEIQRSPRRASIADGVIAVTGHPEDFADAVCQILFNEWGLRLRRDLVDLIPKVAIQLSRIGDEQYWIEKPQLVDGAESEEPSSVPDEGATEGDSGDLNEPAGRDPDAPSSLSSPAGGSPASPGGDDKGKGKAQSGAEARPGGKPGRGHTASDREGIIKALIQKRNEIESQLLEATSTGVVPTETGNNEERPNRVFQSDQRFREAVMEYERKRGRIPQLKSETEEGHDIDSFVREKGSLGRKLLRRIEVKGKGVAWTGDQIVEQSDRQYGDASKREVEAGVTLAADFDYWLYVVEDDGSGKLNVLPIRNPAKRAAHYEFRAGTWRHLAEVEEETTPG